jgi:hypothetical protein
VKSLGISRSLGNIIEKYKKQDGMIPDVTKLIFPQNNIDGVSLKKWIMKTLNAHPAEAKAKTEKTRLILLWYSVFK